MEHLGEVRNALAEFESRGASVLAVSFAGEDVAAAYAREHALPFPLAADPSREAYRAYGLARASRAMAFRPSAVLQHVRLRLQGRRAGSAPPDDVYQLGGDFVIGRDGRLLLSHPSVSGDDRPSVVTLLSAIGAS